MKTKDYYVRSSTHSLKFANTGKRKEIDTFLIPYNQLLRELVNYLWPSINPSDPECRKFISNKELRQFDSTLNARMKQCVGKQACAMIGSAIKKRSKQLYVLRKLQRAGEDTSLLQQTIDIQPLVKPEVRNVPAVLDSRFIDIQESHGKFDIFVGVRTKNRFELRVPIKHTKVSRKWGSNGKLKGSIRLSPDSISLIYNIPKSKAVSGGKTVGCDQGSKDVCRFSDGQFTRPCLHGHTLSSIQDKLARSRKNSKGFRRAQHHRENYINWALNQINFKHIGELRLEDLTRLRYKRKTSRKMQHFAYRLINHKIVALSEVEGFKLTMVNPIYRSQRCSECGWVHKANRNGKTFECRACGHLTDADSNAASNLELDLPEIPERVWRERLNLEGFYWNPDGLVFSDHEPIVRDKL